MMILNSLTRIGYSLVRGRAFLFFVILLTSCTSLRNIDIEVAVMPQFPISDDIQSLALLNRSMNLQFTNIKSDSLERILGRNLMSLDSVFLDSIAADTVIQVAAHALFESGRFDVVIPKEKNIVRLNNEEISNPLNSGFINNICRDFNVDAVLILEGFSEQLTTKYYVHPWGQTSYYDEYDATTDIDYKSDWRLYRPQERKPPLRFQVRDSIFWKSNSISIKDLYGQMPRTKEALIGGGIASGLKMAEYISPNWVSQKRHYYLTGKKEIDLAVNLIKENKWEEATEIWARYAKSDSRILRSRIEFNLALAAEMNGDLDLAIDWGLKSFKTNYSKSTEIYLMTLDASRKAKQRESKTRY